MALGGFPFVRDQGSDTRDDHIGHQALMMATAQEVTDTNRSVLALLLSISPVYFLLQSRAKLGLDFLHVGLVQAVLLVVLHKFLSTLRRPRWIGGKRKQAVIQVAAPSITVTTNPASTAVPELPPPPPSKLRLVAPQPIRPSLYPAPLLDTALYNFLSITEPSYLPLIPFVPPLNPNAPSSNSLNKWTSMYSSNDDQQTEVLQHPTTKSLYAVKATFPDVSLKNLFELLMDVGQRKVWDGMTQGSEVIEEFAVAGYKGTVSWLGMKGMPLLKAKDMCVLSVVTLLPPPPGDGDHPHRIVCAGSSLQHPRCPSKPDYSRMEIPISGFIIEDDGQIGSKITQVTDLSGLGSWVPSAVVRTVTQTLIPKSLSKLRRAAATVDQSKSKFEDESWLPTVLGTIPPTDESTSPASEDTLVPSDASEKELSPAATRQVHALVGQLRTITTRLNELEERTTEESQEQEPFISLATKLGLAGGAVAAAAAVALIATWQRRRR